MKYSIVILTSLIISFFAHAETQDNHLYYTKNESPLLLSEHTQYYNFSVKEQLYSHAKPAAATTSICFGSYLLCDALKTALDMQGEPQQNNGKGITLNTFIAAGFITVGSYLLKQVIWDDNPEEKIN